jgi:hypothetical protein
MNKVTIRHLLAVNRVSDIIVSHKFLSIYKQDINIRAGKIKYIELIT